MTQLTPNNETGKTVTHSITMPGLFTREVNRSGYVEYRAKYNHHWPADHPWNEMIMRLTAKFRKQWLAGWKWEKAQ